MTHKCLQQHIINLNARKGFAHTVGEAVKHKEAQYRGVNFVLGHELRVFAFSLFGALDSNSEVLLNQILQGIHEQSGLPFFWLQRNYWARFSVLLLKARYRAVIRRQGADLLFKPTKLTGGARKIAVA